MPQNLSLDNWKRMDIGMREERGKDTEKVVEALVTMVGHSDHLVLLSH